LNRPTGENLTFTTQPTGPKALNFTTDMKVRDFYNLTLLTIPEGSRCTITPQMGYIVGPTTIIVLCCKSKADSFIPEQSFLSVEAMHLLYNFTDSKN
jgi:hypothetical protein